MNLMQGAVAAASQVGMGGCQSLAQVVRAYIWAHRGRGDLNALWASLPVAATGCPTLPSVVLGAARSARCVAKRAFHPLPCTLQVPAGIDMRLRHLGATTLTECDQMM